MLQSKSSHDVDVVIWNHNYVVEPKKIICYATSQNKFLEELRKWGNLFKENFVLKKIKLVTNYLTVYD